MEIYTSGGVLHLVGDFDVRSTAAAREALHSALGRSGDVVVDLSGVQSVDVTALRVLAVATHRASRRGDHLRLRGCGPAVRRMLHISRLIRAVEVERVPVSA